MGVRKPTSPPLAVDGRRAGFHLRSNTGSWTAALVDLTSSGHLGSIDARRGQIEEARSSPGARPAWPAPLGPRWPTPYAARGDYARSWTGVRFCAPTITTPAVVLCAPQPCRSPTTRSTEPWLKPCAPRSPLPCFVVPVSQLTPDCPRGTGCFAESLSRSGHIAALPN